MLSENNVLHLATTTFGYLKMPFMCKELEFLNSARTIYLLSELWI